MSSGKRLVEFTKPTIIGVGNLFVLKPGMNEVDENAWQKALEIEVIQILIRDGILKPTEGAAPENLSGLKATEAIALVQKTVDRDLLERWYVDEKRAGVNKALEERIEAISPASSEPETPSADAE